LYNIGPLAGYLENRAYETIDARSKLERKQATAERRRGRKDQSLTNKLSYARSAEAKAIALADEVALLARWLRDDILSVAGPEYAVRRGTDYGASYLVPIGYVNCRQKSAERQLPEPRVPLGPDVR